MSFHHGIIQFVYIYIYIYTMKAQTCDGAGPCPVFDFYGFHMFLTRALVFVFAIGGPAWPGWPGRPAWPAGVGWPGRPGRLGRPPSEPRLGRPGRPGRPGQPGQTNKCCSYHLGSTVDRIIWVRFCSWRLGSVVPVSFHLGSTPLNKSLERSKTYL